MTRVTIPAFGLLLTATIAALTACEGTPDTHRPIVAVLEAGSILISQGDSVIYSTVTHPPEHGSVTFGLTGGSFTYTSDGDGATWDAV